MGPLVPDIIGNDLNLVVALLIGIAFGWILEQAGFSSSRRLVGLFYGYDFTVLRVFFTAGVTAMAGLIALEHFGLIDMGLVYINPLFIWPAVVGGLIMGLGFVIGGYCPGTSVCAAAIGKTDAMLFLGGALLGVLVFAEGYPLFEELYKSGAAGSPQIFDTLGLPKALFAFMLTSIAILAFWAVSIIEDRSNGRKATLFSFNRVTVAVAVVGLSVGVTGFIMPSKKEALLDEKSDIESLSKHPIRFMSADELAFRLIDDDTRLRIFDFRSKSEFERLRLPHSVSFTADNLFEKDATRLLAVRKQRNVFIADDEKEARRMASIAGELGFENVYVLRGGMKVFESDILSFKPGQTPGTGHSADTQRFRTHAASVLPGIIASNRSTGPVKKSAKRTVGGC